MAKRLTMPDPDTCYKMFKARDARPSARRTSGASGDAPKTRDASHISLHVGYRRPYAYDSLVGFLSFRCIAGVEAVSDGAYRRTARVAHEDGSESCGWVEVADDPERSALRVSVSPSLAESLPAVLGRVRSMFDTDCMPDVVAEGFAAFHEAAPDVAPIDGIRLPGCFDGFEMACRAIIGQQISVRAASTIAGRVAERLGEPVSTPFPELGRLFPTPQRMLEPDAAEQLGQAGVTRSRQQAIIGLAQAICDGQVSLVPGADLAQQSERLLGLKGIGPWTKQYLLMRAYAYPDAFPAADYAVRQAFPGRTPKEVEALSQAWRPWRGYAVMTLWQALASS